MSPVEETDFEGVRELVSAAARDGVSVGPTRRTRWFRVLEGGRPIAVAGLMEVRPGIMRLKGAFVLPTYRGNGYGTALTGARIDAARRAMASGVEALSYRPEFFEALGFKRAGKPRANGAVMVRRPL